MNTTASSSSLFTIILGDFNARFSFWWKNDKTTVQGARLEALTSLHGFHQLISEPIHLLPTSTSCVDLIFTDQSNLVADSGTHSSGPILESKGMLAIFQKKSKKVQKMLKKDKKGQNI